MAWAQLLSFILPFLGGIVGVLGTLSVAAFTKLGERFIGHIFDRRMEAERARLAVLGDRGVRANELEFKAIRMAWEKFVDTYQATLQCVFQAVRHPDFSKMSDDEARQYLSTTSFSENQQRDILSEHVEKRNKVFVRTVEFRDIHAAGQAIYDAHVTLRKEGIFIPEELEKSIGEALQSCSNVRAARFVEFDHGYYEAGSKEKIKFLQQHEGMFNSLKREVRERLMESISRPTLR